MKARLQERPLTRVPTLFWVLATVVCHLPSFFHRIMDDDEAVYAAVAGLMNAGGRLYESGGVDNKFPGVYWLYAAVFNLCGLYSMTAIHVTGLAFVLGTAGVLGWIARCLSGNDRAFGWSALFYGVFSACYYPKMLAANTEIFMMLPLSSSIALAVCGRYVQRPLPRDACWVASGLLLVLACLFKQVAIINAVVVLVAIVSLPAPASRLRPLLLVALGAALSGAGTVWVLSRTASLDGFWRWAIWSLVTKYGRTGWTLRTVGIGLLSYAGYLGSCLVVTIAVVASVRRRDGPGRNATLVAWLLSSIIGVAAGGRFFGHYFVQLLGPLSVMASLQIVHWTHAHPRRGRLFMTMTAVPALFFFLWAATTDAVTGRFARPTPEYVKLGNYIQSITRPSDRIFIWGNFAPLYVSSARLPASRFVGFLRGLNRKGGAAIEQAWDTTDDVWTTLRDELGDRPPALIVDTSSGDFADFHGYPPRRFPAMERLLAGGWQPFAVVEGATLYRPRRR